MENELISVIVPVYNVAEYIRQCVDSLLAQSYSPIEIILVDDGSTDNSGKICDEYGENNEKITVYHKKNGGLSSARNYGIERAKGDLLAFIDSDDYVVSDMIEELYKNLMDNHADVSCCNSTLFFPNGSSKVTIPKFSDFTVLRGEAILPSLYDNFSACNKLYRKNSFKNIRFPEGKLYEDARTTYKIMTLANIATYNPKPMYFYRQRSASIMSSFNPEKYLDRVNVWNELIDALKSKFTLEKINEMKIRKNKLIVELVLSILSSKKIIKNKKLLNQLCQEIEKEAFDSSFFSLKERMAVWISKFVSTL